MPKYAIVMTADAKFLPGVNGMLNACKYYGMGKQGVEFHLVHTFPDDGYIEQAERAFPFLRASSLDSFMLETGRWQEQGERTRSLMKFVRWWYCAERLSDYNAICVLDADRQIVGNFTRYFEMIAKSNMIGLAKNDWATSEWFAYTEEQAMSANPPLYCNPCFLTGSRTQEWFPMIPEYAMDPTKHYPAFHGRGDTTGDMNPMNLILLQTGLIEQVFPLPATQWVFVETGHVRLEERDIGGKRHIGIHSRGDLLHTYHRKFWGQRTCEAFSQYRTDLEALTKPNNVRILWKFTKFFNTELYLKIPWRWYEWGSSEKVIGDK